MNVRPRLRDILTDALIHQPDVEIVADEFRPVHDPEPALADVLIVGTTAPDDGGLPARLLSSAPGMRVLMIATSGDAAVMYELQPRKLPLGEVSAASLVAAIRHGAGPDHAQ